MQSFWLWQDGQAPPISFRDIDAAVRVPNDTVPGSPVLITYVRWLSPDDSQNPNSEFIELSLDPRNAPGGTFDLDGYYLQAQLGTGPSHAVLHVPLELC